MNAVQHCSSAKDGADEAINRLHSAADLIRQAIGIVNDAKDEMSSSATHMRKVHEIVGSGVAEEIATSFAAAAENADEIGVVQAIDKIDALVPLLSQTGNDVNELIRTLSS